MAGSYAQSPKYAAAGQQPRAVNGRSLPVVQDEYPRRVRWIVAVPMAAFVVGIAAGAVLTAGLIRIVSR